MEQLLSTHGGNYKTDFGLRETIDFGESEQNNPGWNRLYGYIQGKVHDDRIEDTIHQMMHHRENESLTKNSNKQAPIKAIGKAGPESLTDLTRVFISKMGTQKNPKKKLKQIRLVKGFKRNKKSKSKNRYK